MSRFAVEWLVPTEAARLTHVMLLDKDRPAPHTLAVGHGQDKERALLNLWRTLVDSGATPEAIDYVALELRRRTGRSPDDPVD
jgi:hypothetical protein